MTTSSRLAQMRQFVQLRLAVMAEARRQIKAAENQLRGSKQQAEALAELKQAKRRYKIEEEHWLGPNAIKQFCRETGIRPVEFCELQEQEIDQHLRKALTKIAAL